LKKAREGSFRSSGCSFRVEMSFLSAEAWAESIWMHKCLEREVDLQ